MIEQNYMGYPEISQDSLAFRDNLLIHAATSTVLDLFSAIEFRAARYTIVTENEINQIEINDLYVLHDDTDCYVRSLSSLNNISGNTYVSQFSAELTRDHVRLSITSVGQRNRTQFHKILIKRR